MTPDFALSTFPSVEGPYPPLLHLSLELLLALELLLLLSSLPEISIAVHFNTREQATAPPDSDAFRVVTQTDTSDSTSRPPDPNLPISNQSSFAAISNVNSEFANDAAREITAE